MIRFNSTNLFDTRIELGSLPYKAEMIKRVKIGHMETETRKYASPLNLVPRAVERTSIDGL